MDDIQQTLEHNLMEFFIVAESSRNLLAMLWESIINQ
jgi:hypothetical protein